MDAEIEGEAERTKRMLYHCGVHSQWVLLYANSLHKFYSKHTDVLDTLAAGGGVKEPRGEKSEKLTITKTDGSVFKGSNVYKKAFYEMKTFPVNSTFYFNACHCFFDFGWL